MLISVVTDPGGIGGTFLTWSLHFLSGHTKYFSEEKNSWLKLPDSPLTGTNAHGFITNHLNRHFDCSYENVVDITNLIQQTKTDTFHTIYYHNFHNDLDTLVPAYYKDKTKKNIFVSGRNYPLFHVNYNKRYPALIGPDTFIHDSDEIYNFFSDTYFKESKKSWDNLNNTWDKREFIALNFKPFNLASELVEDIDCCYRMDAMELWCNFNFTIDTLFEYLEIPVDQSRLEHWNTVYNKWKKIHHDNLQFVWQFDTIIDYILKNKHMDLAKFNLDIGQEAAIQHELLYKYNLNFKTWQLEKFIDTKQLHVLLEPNIHKLT